MNNFYTAFLMGGLGNQMFQISNTLSRGFDDGVECFFKKTSFTPMQGNETLHYINNIFEKIIFKDDITVDLQISEPNWYHNNLTYPKGINIEFYGYFQSSKNFGVHAEKIKKLFRPSEKYKNKIIQKYPKLKENDTLSIHVRRGDSFKNLDIHPVITTSYIEKSISKIKNISTIFVFTDDKDWCMSNLKLNNVFYVNEDDYIELWMMSMCKNNIISNSTFSWWGSFLNENPQKIVVAPSVWFGPRGPKNYLDIYEKNWVLVDVIYKNGFLEYNN